MPPWWPVLFAIPVFWFALLTFIAYVGGWQTLASTYRAVTPFDGRLRRFRSLTFGVATNYNGSVNIGTNAEGLYLAVLLPFRPGHPPLFIPWSDVSISPRKRWFTNWYEFRFAKTPGISLFVRESIGREIAVDANRAWTSEEGVPT